MEDGELYSLKDSKRVRNPNNALVWRVLAVVAGQLAVTCAIAVLIYCVEGIREYIVANVWTTIAGYLAFFASMIALHFLGRKHPANIVLFCVLTIALGWVVGTVTSFYSVPVLLVAMSLTIAIFLVLSMVALFSKRDFSFLMGRAHRPRFFSSLPSCSSFLSTGSWSQ